MNLISEVKTAKDLSARVNDWDQALATHKREVNKYHAEKIGLVN